jgi:hypothetical protein
VIRGLFSNILDKKVSNEVMFFSRKIDKQKTSPKTGYFSSLLGWKMFVSFSSIVKGMLMIFAKGPSAFMVSLRYWMSLWLIARNSGAVKRKTATNTMAPIMRVIQLACWS